MRSFAVRGVCVLIGIAGLLAGCAGDDGGPTGDATLTSLAVDVGPFNEPFDPSVTQYTVSTGSGTPEITVTAATPTEGSATVTVNGGNVTDPANLTVNLTEGRNVLSVRVTTSGGAAKIYTVTVTRARVPTPAFIQEAYAKASNTGAEDQFGYSVALDGDTLAVGAPSENSGISGNEADNSADNAGAVYVFQRDSGTSTWTFQAYLKAATPGKGDKFGRSVALSGDTLVVGAPLEDSAETGTTGTGADNSAVEAGAAYVFVRSGVTWTQQAYVKASNTDAGDRFGWSVGVDGDTLVVGALLEDSAETGTIGTGADNSASHAGAAYVFVRSGTTWTQEAYVKASNTNAGDDFGVSIALSGNTLAVGATGESSTATGIDGNQSSNGATTSGAVYVFVRSGTVWTQEAYLKASNTGAADNFGQSVALDGDTMAVGAPREDGATTGVGGSETSNGAADAGAVYVFFRSGTAWSQQAYVKASNTNAGDNFGWGVALSVDTLAVGAVSEDSASKGVDNDTDVGQPDNSAPTAGAAYVFVRSGADWAQLDYVKASNTASRDGFGGSVALGVDTLGVDIFAVGGIGEGSHAMGVDGDQDDDSAALAGAVYLFKKQ